MDSEDSEKERKQDGEMREQGIVRTCIVRPFHLVRVAGLELQCEVPPYCNPHALAQLKNRSPGNISSNGSKLELFQRTESRFYIWLYAHVPCKACLQSWEASQQKCEACLVWVWRLECDLLVMREGFAD